MPTKKPTSAFSFEDLTEALRGARVGVWDWDVTSNHLRWSEETYWGLAASLRPEDRTE